VNAKSVAGAPNGRQASPGPARSAVVRFSPREQAVCLELMRGESISHIAEMLHCDHSTVGRLIAGIRRQLHAQNLQGWVRR
jgi:DNA-binding NarL/FixJ family response regulator